MLNVTETCHFWYLLRIVKAVTVIEINSEVIITNSAASAVLVSLETNTLTHKTSSITKELE